MDRLTRRDTLRALGVAGVGAGVAGTATTASAQSGPPGVAWRTRDGETPELAAIVRAGEGYTYLGTAPSDDGDSFQSIVLGRLDSDGERVWRRTFDSPDGDLTATALTTTDGEYYACGVRVDPEGVPTPFVLATDAEGRQRWRLDAAGDMATGIGRVADTILVVGWRRGEEQPIRPAFSRYRLNGAELGRRVERLDGIVPTDVVQTGDGSYRLVGEQRRTNSPTLLFVADINERAEIETTEKFGYLSNVTVGGAVPVGETDTLVTGSLGGDRGLVLRVGPDGEKRWETTIAEAPTRITAVDGGLAAPGDGVVVAGSQTPDGDERPWAARVGVDGGVEWASTYGPVASNTATGVALGPDGRFVLGGPTIVNSAWFAGVDPTVTGTPTPTATPTATPTEQDTPTPTATPTGTTGTATSPGGSGGDLPLGLIGGAAVVGGAIALAGVAVLRLLGGGDAGGSDDAGDGDGSGDAGDEGGAAADVQADPGDEVAGDVSTDDADSDGPADGTDSTDSVDTADSDTTTDSEAPTEDADSDVSADTDTTDDAGTETTDGTDATDDAETETTDETDTTSDADSDFEFGDEQR